MINLKDKKIIGAIVVSIIILAASILIYRNNESQAFKEEYMTEIFDDNTDKNTDEINEETTNSTEGFKENDVVSKNIIVVEIKGEVNQPDVYELEEGSIVKDLIDMAGGLKEEADIRSINRAEELKDHELIIIGNINDEVNQSNVVSASSNVNTEESSLININTAEIDELKEITGIGDTKAQNIINYREKNGGFKSLEELKNVDGIGDKTFEKIKEEITL